MSPGSASMNVPGRTRRRIVAPPLPSASASQVTGSKRVASSGPSQLVTVRPQSAAGSSALVSMTDCTSRTSCAGSTGSMP